jgi:hypothetical protein
MTIFKDQQRDERHFWPWLFGLFGQKCRSYLAQCQGKRRDCNKRRGHPGKHTDGDFSWGYGDNWLDGN